MISGAESRRLVDDDVRRELLEEAPTRSSVPGFTASQDSEKFEL
jgi:hypothetical protein